MQTLDRYSKVILTLLMLGVWGILLRPLLGDASAWAQKGKSESQAKPGVPTVATSKSAVRYAVATATKPGDVTTVRFDPTARGSVSFSGEDLGPVLAEASKQGWQLHAIVPYIGGGNGILSTSYMVIVEK